MSPKKPEENAEPSLVDDCTEEASKVLNRHVLYSMGVGLLPFPLMDALALAAVQVSLLTKLAALHGVPYAGETARGAVASLIGSTIPVIAGRYLGRLALKWIPVVGQPVSMLTIPVAAGAATYALGKVFIQHFASGGTFLTFDPTRVQDYYREKLREAEQVATILRGSQGSTTQSL